MPTVLPELAVDRDRFPWLRDDRPENLEGVCGQCYTSLGHLAEMRDCQTKYEFYLDDTKYDGRPPAELRGRLANLKIAAERRAACPGPHFLPPLPAVKKAAPTRKAPARKPRARK